MHFTMFSLLLASIPAPASAPTPMLPAPPAAIVAVPAPSAAAVEPASIEPPLLVAESKPTSAEPPLHPASSADDPLPRRYPYASIQAGVGFPNSLSGSFDFLGLASLNNRLDLNSGLNSELAVGYKFPDLRTDLSLGYSSFASNRQTLTAPGFGSASVPGRGSVNLLTLMANAYVDFKIRNQQGTRSRWSPYIGGGLGLGYLSTPGCAATVAAGSCNTFSGGSSATLAYQLKLGVAYRATRSGFVFLEGGYLGTTAARVNNVNYDPFGTWRINLGWRQKL